jgi:hypothetical protein
MKMIDPIKKATNLEIREKKRLLLNKCEEL